jgi:ribosomal RNA-processing protein 1
VDGVISDTVANVKKDDEGLIPLAVQQTGEEIRDSSLVRGGESSVDISIINDAVISNLEQKFALINDQESFESNFGGLLSPVNAGSKKKRKRGKKGEESEPSSGAEVMQLLPSKVDTPATGSNSSAKKKKVRFMLKNNLVWKQGPLPPQSMRTPPAATPRGSALKKGALPGPIHSSPSLIYQTMPIPRGCSPIQILSVTVQKPSRSPKSLSNGVPKQVRNSPGSS